MIIHPFRKYVVSCLGSDKKTYRWHLWMEPYFKAWNVVDQEIKVGEVFKGHLILSVEDVTDKPYGAMFSCMDLWKRSEKSTNRKFEDDLAWPDDVDEDEFERALASTDLCFAVDPSYSQSYRCQICGGVVANDICTQCCFDWDS